MSPRLAPQLMRPGAARALPHHRLPSPLPPSNSATTPSTVVPTVLETVLYASQISLTYFDNKIKGEGHAAWSVVVWAGEAGHDSSGGGSGWREPLRPLHPTTRTPLQENKAIKSALENLTSQCSHNAGEITQLNNIVKDTNAKLTEMEKALDSRLTGIETALSKPPAKAQDQTFLEALENKLDSVDKKTTTTIQALEQKVSNIFSKDLGGPAASLGQKIDTRELRRCLTELEQIEQRKHNLIILNLPEEETLEEDLKSATCMIKEEFKLIVKINKAARLEEMVPTARTFTENRTRFTWRQERYSRKG
ncbi:hypothetical protein Pcinc_022333 [Petrolisthes cinctipes]|uniref:Uncharacterized protein n=1 Tax=Petrolisthes cinctipes TaxID=88211 RepID=A0AAE1FE44_PETCI|nr:hypothetical protein Pcinc_022333 [Petrolisthes cinctipes]